MGAMLVQLAAQAGAEVIAVSRRMFALSIAGQYGARHLVRMNPFSEVIKKVRDITCGDGCEAVIEAVGAQETLDLATELTAVRGKLVVAGYHQDGPRQVNMQMWNWRGLDVINAHERDPQVYTRGIEHAIRAIEMGTFRPCELLTHIYSPQQLPEAIEAMKERPDGFLKGCLRFED
jgi:threonine dehydrogenase-like Zn-dependent dehydrogenase